MLLVASTADDRIILPNSQVSSGYPRNLRLIVKGIIHIRILLEVFF